MADTDNVCATAEGVVAGDVHVGKEAVSSCDSLKGIEVDSHGDTTPIVTSENGIDQIVTQTSGDHTTPVGTAEPISGSGTTEAVTDTTDSGSQAGTKRKTDDVDDIAETTAGEEVKKAKKDDEHSEPVSAEKTEVSHSEISETDGIKGVAETNGKPHTDLPVDEIVTKTVDDVVNADQAVEAV